LTSSRWHNIDAVVATQWEEFTRTCCVEARERLILYYIQFIKEELLSMFGSWCMDRRVREDVFSAATMGLIEAVDHFDRGLGNAFMTYASKWIYVRVARAIDEIASRGIKGRGNRNERPNVVLFSEKERVDGEGYTIPLENIIEALQDDETYRERSAELESDEQSAATVRRHVPYERWLLKMLIEETVAHGSARGAITAIAERTGLHKASITRRIEKIFGQTLFPNMSRKRSKKGQGK
jgi:hypothetical protein